MLGKERAVESFKTVVGAGLWAADLAIRQAEALPVAGHAVSLGRFVVYKAGTKAIFDTMVENQRRDIQNQIEGDIICVSGPNAGTVKSDVAGQELYALQKFVELHGPTTYEELCEVADCEAAAPQAFPTRQLDKFLTEVDKADKSEPT